MSVSYKARVLFGFILDEQPVKKSVKKFNENTGEPYETTEHSHDKVCIDGVDVLNDPDKNVYDLDKLDGMEIIESGYDNGQMLLGTVIAKVDDYNPVQVLEADQSFKAVKEFSDSHGITPRLYVVQSC